MIEHHTRRCGGRARRPGWGGADGRIDGGRGPCATGDTDKCNSGEQQTGRQKPARLPSPQLPDRDRFMKPARDPPGLRGSVVKLLVLVLFMGMGMGMGMTGRCNHGNGSPCGVCQPHTPLFTSVDDELFTSNAALRYLAT